MPVKIIHETFLIIGLLANLSLAWPWVVLHNNQLFLTVVVCDVGQGDAILLKSSQGFDMLIDGGPPSSAALNCLGKFLPPWDTTIELLVITHPDLDHIGGLVEIVRRYQINKVISSGASSPSNYYQLLLKELANRQVRVTMVRAGDLINITPDFKANILWPMVTSSGMSTNYQSLVMKVNFGQAAIILTGDVEQEAEAEIVKINKDIKSDLLKISHHGSRSASSELWLKALRPQTALISVGTNNRYGHPHPTVLRRLQNLGISINRTDQSGDLVWQTYGQNWQRLKP